MQVCQSFIDKVNLGFDQIIAIYVSKSSFIRGPFLLLNQHWGEVNQFGEFEHIVKRVKPNS